MAKASALSTPSQGATKKNSKIRPTGLCDLLFPFDEVGSAPGRTAGAGAHSERSASEAASTSTDQAVQLPKGPGRSTPPVRGCEQNGAQQSSASSVPALTTGEARPRWAWRSGAPSSADVGLALQGTSSGISGVSCQAGGPEGLTQRATAYLFGGLGGALVFSIFRKGVRAQ